jgi:hypothetical protein
MVNGFIWVLLFIYLFIYFICQWLAADQWFSLCTPVSSTNKTDHHDIAEILLKVTLNTITLTPPYLFHHWQMKTCFIKMIKEKWFFFLWKVDIQYNIVKYFFLFFWVVFIQSNIRKKLTHYKHSFWLHFQIWVFNKLFSQQKL